MQGAFHSPCRAALAVWSCCQGCVWSQCRPYSMAGSEGHHLNQSPKDSSQQLSSHVQAPASPGRVPSQAIGQGDGGIHVAARHICCCIDCSTMAACMRRQSPSTRGLQHPPMPALHADVRAPCGPARGVEESLTDDSKREAISKGSHLVICAPTINLKYGHANELREQGRPQPPAVLVRLQMQKDVTSLETCEA